MLDEQPPPVVPIRVPRRARAQRADQLPAQLRDEPVAGRMLDLLVEARSLQQVLTALATLAVETVPDCRSASFTVIRRGVPTTIAASDDRALEIDETQYEAGAGPCLQAARTDRVVQTDDVTRKHPAVDEGDPAWSATARGLGVTATLSVPIPAGRDVAAAINLYRTSGPGWSAEDLAAAEDFATYAGSALLVAYRIDRFSEQAPGLS